MSEYDPVVMKAIEGLSEKEAYDKIHADDELQGLARMARFDLVRKAEEAAAMRALRTGSARSLVASCGSASAPANACIRRRAASGRI
jgi:hypothetical protein